VKKTEQQEQDVGSALPADVEIKVLQLDLPKNAGVLEYWNKICPQLQKRRNHKNEKKPKKPKKIKENAITWAWGPVNEKVAWREQDGATRRVEARTTPKTQKCQK